MPSAHLPKAGLTWLLSNVVSIAMLSKEALLSQMSLNKPGA